MIYTVLRLAYNFFILCIFVRVIFSWVPDLPQPLYPIRRFADNMTDWAIKPIQRIVPPLPLGGIYLDMSVIVLLILVQVVMSVLQLLLNSLL